MCIRVPNFRSVILDIALHVLGIYLRVGYVKFYKGHVTSVGLPNLAKTS